MANSKTCYNSIPTSKNELVKKAPSEDSSIPTLTSIVFRTFTLASTPSMLNIYIDIDLQKATKLAL